MNSTRQKVTKDCCDRFTEGKQSFEVEFIYDGNKELYPVCLGMPVLATTNLKSEEIYNMMEFSVEQMNDQNVTINGTVFPISKFVQSFIPAFCQRCLHCRGWAVHSHAKTGNYQWTFSHSRRILRLRRIIDLQNPSNLTEKPTDKVRRIAHPIKTVPFSLSDRNYPTDNPS